MHCHCVEDGWWHENEADVEWDVHWHEGADAHEPGKCFVSIGMHRRADDICSQAQLVLLLSGHLHLVIASLFELLGLALFLISDQLLHLYDLRLCLESVLECSSCRDR